MNVLSFIAPLVRTMINFIIIQTFQWLYSHLDQRMLSLIVVLFREPYLLSTEWDYAHFQNLVFYCLQTWETLTLIWPCDPVTPGCEHDGRHPKFYITLTYHSALTRIELFCFEIQLKWTDPCREKVAREAMPVILLPYTCTYTHICMHNQSFWNHWVVLMLGRHFLTVLEVNPCCPKSIRFIKTPI